MVSPESPRGSVPIPATEVPTKSRSRRGSRVLQSSLDIAFSYSRSQQRRYGHIRSAPSFVDVTSSPEEHEDEQWDEEQAHLLREPHDEEEARAVETSERRRSSSGDSFSSDPFRLSPHSLDPAHYTQQTHHQGQGQGQVSERTPLLPTPAGRNPSITFAPDGIGVGVAGSPGASASAAAGSRRRSSAAVIAAARKRRPHDVGESTNGQTLFNAIAVLVGIGLLSLPLAFAYAGWIGGTILLLGFAFVTCHTAKLLARLILSDRSLLGYTDIGKRAFGGWASGAINILFCMELFALSVALVVLFGDTLSVIFPAWSSNTFKLLGFLIVLPTTLLPLHLLSLPSLLSTLSSLLLILILLVDGFIKTSPPGSLLHPATTNWLPEWYRANWLGGVGLILAGFGGHAVVPGLARDMKHPECFERVINRAFVIATAISFVAGAAGYLMVGNGVSDEITRDLLQPKYAYPRLLNLFALWMIVINPVTKFGLCTRPLNVTIETVLGISPSTPGDESQIVTSGHSSHAPAAGGGARDDAYEDKQAITWLDRRKTLYRLVSRICTTAICALTAILLPGFGKVMAFLGSFSAFLICIILPLLFHLRLAPSMLGPQSPLSRRLHSFAVVFSIALMVAGTTWAFLPGSGHGGLDDGRT